MSMMTRCGEQGVDEENGGRMLAASMIVSQMRWV